MACFSHFPSPTVIGNVIETVIVEVAARWPLANGFLRGVAFKTCGPATSEWQPGRPSLSVPIPIIGNMRAAVSGPGYHTACFTKEWDARFLQAFGDICVVLHDVDEFASHPLATA